MKRYRLTELTPRLDADRSCYIATGVLAENNAMWTVSTLSFFMMKDYESSVNPAAATEPRQWNDLTDILAAMLRSSEPGRPGHPWMDAERVQLDLDRLVELQVLEIDLLN